MRNNGHAQSGLSQSDPQGFPDLERTASCNLAFIVRCECWEYAEHPEGSVIGACGAAATDGSFASQRTISERCGQCLAPEDS